MRVPGINVKCDWKVGSPWTLSFPDGRIAGQGEMVEFTQLKSLAIKWQNEWKPEMKAEGFSFATFDLEPMDNVVKLTVTHGMDMPNSKFIEAVAGGWPFILSNLKSLLETDKVIMSEFMKK